MPVRQSEGDGCFFVGAARIAASRNGTTISYGTQTRSGCQGQSVLYAAFAGCANDDESQSNCCGGRIRMSNGAGGQVHSVSRRSGPVSRQQQRRSAPTAPYNRPHMSIAPGTPLGAYEIVALIGSGGMGEVTVLAILGWVAPSRPRWYRPRWLVICSSANARWP